MDLCFPTRKLASAIPCYSGLGIIFHKRSITVTSVEMIFYQVVEYHHSHKDHPTKSDYYGTDKQVGRTGVDALHGALWYTVAHHGRMGRCSIRLTRATQPKIHCCYSPKYISCMKKYGVSLPRKCSAAAALSSPRAMKIYQHRSWLVL
ncbi:hypothetical protein QAD02_017157 [Eretmocerus hayati]|uniref:Uncharacterized protein n=1 Tax=Eretmocerus hayati TaxID=131215 RepID=A0ACC2PCN0_9HYME|nr:hypothetical protein QAD02_017157 [Eretmocerus hayati]